MTPELVAIIIAAVTPFVVQGATALIKLALPALQGWGIVAVVVPLLALVVTFVTNLVTNAGPAWYIQLAVGLLAVFVNELYKQLKQAISPTP